MAIKNIFKKKQWKADYEAGRDAFNAGQFKAAETHLRSAMVKAIELDDSAYGDTTLLLGQVMRRLERFDESLELTEKSFRYYIGFFGPSDARTVSAHLSLVLADGAKADNDAALRQATYHKAVEQFGPKSWQVVRTAALALAHLSSSEREKALGYAQDAMAFGLGEGRQELGAWPPVAEEFALELARLNYTDLAARFMASQLRVHEERFGDKSEEAALTRLTLGEFFLRCGEWRKAETALTKALEQIKLKHGPKSDLARRGTICLGQALARQGRLEQAAPFLTESLEKLRGDQSQERTEALVWLLEYKCMIAATDAERGALWRELEMAWENNSSDANRARIYQGFSAAQRRLQEAWELGAADRFLQAVLNRVRQWRGPHHADVAAIMMDLGLCAALREDDPKAMSYAEQSLALDEGVDNLIRSVALYGELGERERAVQSSKMALRLVRSFSVGLEQGRRQASFALALLKAGELEMATEQAAAALEQLPEAEQDAILLVQAEIGILNGQWAQAERLYKQALPRLTEPVGRAKAHLQYAWLLCLSGRFSEMQEALTEVQSLTSLRREHPIIIAAKAVASQGAFYSGNIYQGKEERDEVFNFLRKGQHQQTRRALSILTLLDPFGPDEYGTELDVGTQILAASRYPEAVCTVFPTKDVACMGLRHLTRALFFHGQEALAQERLSQYKQRFASAYGDLNSPLASSLHLCAASLAATPSEKVEELEAARRGLRDLGARHVNLFPTLSLLAEQYIEVGAAEKAKVTIAEALAIRKSGRLKDWLAALERGEMPSLGADPAAREPAVEAVPGVVAARAEADPSSYETLTQPPDSEPEPAAAEADPEAASTETVDMPTVDAPEYQEAPRTEDETPATPLPTPELPTGFESRTLDDSGTLVAYAGASEVSKIPMALALAERDNPPSPEEVEAFLEEVKARFGTDRRARQDAQLMLALLFPDGSEQAVALWNEALNEVFQEDFETLLHLETRARDANATSLVLETLQRRLSDEVGRYGEQATESIETLSRMARTFEGQGLLDDAYQRVTLVAEILRSWFGARSRRLLEPLTQLIRLSEKREDVTTALEHHIERHRLLESGQSAPEELFSSRVALLPIRALLGQVSELMDEAATSQSELSMLGPSAASEFASVLLTTALRLERLHWRVQEAVRLLEMALSAAPDNEVSLVCRLQVAFAECQARRDYRSQAETLRQRAMDRVTALESESRAEILHEAAQSCIRVRELAAAREIAEKVLEERIADGGRKDQWAGRALLVLAEADLRSYRLEGTETAIAMSRPSLEGSPYWAKAQLLKSQAEFFLGREEEAYAIIDALPTSDTLELQLPLAVWRGRAEQLCTELETDPDSLLAQRWKTLESAPMDEAVGILEFLARAGKVRLLQAGMDRIEPRLKNLLPTDIRTARTDILRASLMLWEGRWSDGEALLQRVLDILPPDRVEMPEGLSMLTVRSLLISCLLAQDKVKQAEVQAKTGASEAAEVLGEEDIRAIAFRSHAAYCAEARGDQEESMVILDEILVPLQDRLGETHALLRDIYRGLSKAFSEQDDLESARITAEEALRIDKECRGLSIHLIEDLHLLSRIERHEDIAEARNLLDTAVELGSQVLPAGHPYNDRLEADLEALDQDPDEVDTDDADPDEEFAPIPQADLASPLEADDSEDIEASLDGWEVVEDQEADEEGETSEIVEQDSDEDGAVESAEALFDSQEDYVEDSAFESPVVNFETNRDSEESDSVAQDELSDDEPEPKTEPSEAEFRDDATGLELTEEEVAEERAAELELTEEEAAEERAAELELAEEKAAEERAAERESAEREALIAISAETEDSEEESADEPVAELEIPQEDSADEQVAESEILDEATDRQTAELGIPEGTDKLEISQEVAVDPEAESEAGAEFDDSEELGGSLFEDEPEGAEVAVEEPLEQREDEALAQASEFDESELATVEPEATEQTEDEADNLTKVEERDEALVEPEVVQAVLAEAEAEVATEAADEDADDDAEANADAEAGADETEVEAEAETAAELPSEEERAEADFAVIAEATEETSDLAESDEPSASGELTDALGETDQSESESVDKNDAADSEPEVPAAKPISASPYKVTAAYHAGPRSTSASVELSPDFPPVPFRVPIITDLAEPEPEPELEPESVVDSDPGLQPGPDVELEPESLPVAEAAADDGAEDQAEEQAVSEPSLSDDQPEILEAAAEQENAEADDQPNLAAEDQESPEAALEQNDPAPSSGEDWSSAEIPSEVSEETEGSASFSISIEQMAEQVDPEASLLPLAPVFFLPVPWKEATEAAFDEDYELLHERFQEEFNTDGNWREVVDQAVSIVRQDPTPAAGYFLFLVGAQLEKGGRLHTADLCLATAIELLETGSAFGAACHLAGRVAGRRGELRRALDYFERAAELADEPELAVLKVDAAECHLGLGRPEEALIGFEEVFDYLNESVPKVQSLAVQAKMAQIHLLIGDPDTSQALAEDVLQRLSPKNEGTYRVLGRILLSRAYARLGRHELALELAEQAWEGAKPWSAKRREGRRIAISNLVDIYSLVGRYDKAEEMIRESGLVGWGLAESELLLRAGHVACALGKYDAARSYLRLGQSFLTRFRSPALWRSSFLELEAELALQLGDPARADLLSRQALKLFEQEATGPVDRSRHLVRAARIAGALGDIVRAKELVEEAHSLRDLHLGAQHPHTESVEGLSAVFG